jgi:4-hydroxybenzoate polyprenyltransferase
MGLGRTWRAGAVPLLLSCHPVPAAAMTVAMTLAAALTGRGVVGSVLVAATVACGQLTIGWLNDLCDAERDRRAGRRDKPVAAGRIAPGAVWAAFVVAALLVVPLSLANGTAAGVAHLGYLLGAWLYDVGLKRTPLSWLPYVVSFGLLPAFLSYGGVGLGMHGAPPTVVMTVLAALLGVGVHFLNTLPDHDEDRANGVRHLPLLVATRVGQRRLWLASTTYTAVVGVALVVAALTVGVRQ